jgi:branched-chain amino acid transport system permease protein
MNSGAALLQLVVSGVGMGSIYALVALGFNIVFKATGAINFAQGEWVMVGGVLAASLLRVSGGPYWAMLAAAALGVAFLAILSERLVVFPLRSPTPMLITMMTIGLAIATKSLVMLVFGTDPNGYAAFSGDTPIHLAGASIAPQTLWICGVTAVVMVATQLFFDRTLLGQALRATAADRTAARLVGIDVRRMTMWSFGLAGLIGAIAGICITPMIFTDYNSGTVLGFKGFSAAMLGGIGSLYGAVAGGLLLGVLEALAGGFIASGFKDATAFLALLLILFLRPSGLFGAANATRV